MLPEKVQNFFIKNSTSNLIPKVAGPNTGFDISLEGQNIYFTLNGKKVLFPFVNYIYDIMVTNNEACYDLSLVEKFYTDLGLDWKKYIREHIGLAESLKEREGIPNFIDKPYVYKDIYIDRVWRDYYISIYDGKNNLDLKCFLYDLIRNLKTILGEKNQSRIINPFTDLNLDNNNLLKILLKMGGSIDSSDRQKKSGTLQLLFQKFQKMNAYRIVIVPSGYIRRLNINSDRGILLSGNPNLGAPIYSEDDLNIKLNYVIGYVMRDYLKGTEVGTKIANMISKYYITLSFFTEIALAYHKQAYC
ncbi:MAG: hypothetical protein EBS19_14705 [Spirochaetia bacterium]|nr:hypothetical protein [Spirochaetia bacterium]